MGKLSLIFSIAIGCAFSVLSHAEDLNTPEVVEWMEQARKRCAPSEHPVVYRSDFRWGLNFLEAADLFKKMYASQKRLQHRFYYDEAKGLVGPYGWKGDQLLSIPARFVYSIKKHIETALSLEYVQWVIFPDMGHNHFFIEQQEYDSWAGLSTEELMLKFMNSPKTQMLYHTLEQIQAMDENKVLYTDSWTQWRYYTRNIVGDNEGKGNIEILKNLTGNYNTVSEREGHKYWGAGVNLSAAQDGCFSYEHQGKTYYFDVSFDDLPSNPDNASGDEY